MTHADPDEHIPEVGPEPPDDNYLTWLAERQLAKQSMGELAHEQDIRAAVHDALDEVTLDARKLAPRYAPVVRRALPMGEAVDISKAIRAVDLLKLSLPPLKWVVPDLVPEGTTLLAAPPKIGKSSLIYQMCVEIPLGGRLLARPVSKGSVLYLALEDGPRRGQNKIRLALAGREMPDKLDIWWNAPAIGAGLEEALAEWVQSKDDPTLIAIDTLERVRPSADPRKNAYSVDVAHISQLQSAFRDSDVALVIVHHARKEKGDDFVQAVSGTYGLTGSVDTILSIERKRNDPYAVIRATGREVGEIELPARLDPTGLWHYAAEALANASSERLEVFEVIRSRGPVWAKQVAAVMGKEGESGRISVQQMMTKMAAEGVIERGRSGYSVSRSVDDYSDYSEGQKH